MKCPVCKTKQSFWKLIRISRWTSITCPQCSSRLNRRQNVQFFLIGVLCIALMWIAFAYSDGQEPLFIALSVCVSAVFYWIDYFTIKLVVTSPSHGVWNRLKQK